MEEHILQQIKNDCAEQGFPCLTIEDVVSALVESKHIYSKHLSSHRWWDVCLYVVKIGSMLIGFEYAHTTGDTTAEDLGYELDMNRVWEMRPIDKTVVEYEPIGGDK